MVPVELLPNSCNAVWGGAVGLQLFVTLSLRHSAFMLVHHTSQGKRGPRDPQGSTHGPPCLTVYINVKDEKIDLFGLLSFLPAPLWCVFSPTGLQYPLRHQNFNSVSQLLKRKVRLWSEHPRVAHLAWIMPPLDSPDCAIHHRLAMVVFCCKKETFVYISWHPGTDFFFVCLWVLFQTQALRGL